MTGPGVLVVVVTVLQGRHDHLVRQRASLAAQRRPADLHVVVAMDDDPPLDTVGPPVDLVPVSVEGGRLPLAAARNAGVGRALELGADVVVLLDVDVLAGPDLIGAYAAAVTDRPDVVWSGPVTYLTQEQRPYDLTALPHLDDPHPARPAPAPGERVLGADPRLFWSLSFGLAGPAWKASGGFDERYAGYGGEDTDFGMRCRRAGVTLGWVGGARGYHQWHPTSSPPVRHLDDLLRNGRTFAETWGWWPMEGWFDQLQDLGLVERAGSGWRRTPRGVRTVPDGSSGG